MDTVVSDGAEVLPPQFVAGEGLWGSPFMVVGEAPGATEAEQLRPFVGRSGQELRSALRSCGVEEDRIWITNIYKLRPENNRAPRQSEIEEHLQYLAYEIQEGQPKYILALGNIAFHTLTDSIMGVSLYRGFWHPLAEQLQRVAPDLDPRAKDHIDLIQPIVLPTYHPAYILRNRKQTEIWRKDIHTWFTKGGA